MKVSFEGEKIGGRLAVASLRLDELDFSMAFLKVPKKDHSRVGCPIIEEKHELGMNVTDCLCMRSWHRDHDVGDNHDVRAPLIDAHDWFVSFESEISYSHQLAKRVGKCEM